ncbi:MAG: RNA polymerase sigma factor [Candidatus Paceibacterota bacterium]
MKAPNTKEYFEEIYANEADTLFRYCLFRISNRAQAIDIVQEVFIELWQALQKDEDIRNPRAFLFAVLRNRIIDWYRKKKSVSLDAMMHRREDEKNFEPEDPKASKDIIWSAEVTEIIEAINFLPDPYREPVYLRLIEDLSPPEIARMLESNANTISIRITRGIKKLQKYLNIEDLV